MNVRDPWVNSFVAADHIGKSVLTTRRWAARGDLPGVKKGGEWMFQLSAIDEHLNASTTDPWQQSPRSRNRRRTV